MAGALGNIYDLPTNARSHSDVIVHCVRPSPRRGSPLEQSEASHYKHALCVLRLSCCWLLVMIIISEQWSRPEVETRREAESERVETLGTLVAGQEGCAR